MRRVIEVPDPVLIVETHQSNSGMKEFYDVEVRIGDTVIFERQYYYGQEINEDHDIYSAEEAQEEALSEFGQKLKSLLDSVG